MPVMYKAHMEKQGLEQIWLEVGRRIGEGERAHGEASVMSVLGVAGAYRYKEKFCSAGRGARRNMYAHFRTLQGK